MESANVQARRNYADLQKGELEVVSGREVKRIRLVRTGQISQMRPPADNPTGERVQTQVNQWHFSMGGRSFTITGDDAAGNALTNTLNGSAAKGKEVVEVYLIANEYRKPAVDAEGNVQYEDDGTTPILSDTVNKTWTFDGLVTASEDMAQEERDTKKIAMRNKANILSNVNVMDALKAALKEEAEA